MKYEWYLYAVSEEGFRTLIGSGVGDEVAIPDDLDPDNLDPYAFDAQSAAIAAASAAISGLHGEQVFLEENRSEDRLSFSLYCTFPHPLSPSFSHYLVHLTPFIS